MISIEHKVHYYETDKMGIVHHSNYIRMFEDARLEWLDQAGAAYAPAEAEGVISPVVGVSCDYRYPLRFGDVVNVRVRATKYTGVKLAFAYEVVLPDGTVAASGMTKHCFQRGDSPRPVSAAKEWPRIHENLGQAFKRDEEEAAGIG